MREAELEYERARAETLGLFEGFGIEIEYMLVTAERLDVAPICDRLLAAAAGSVTNEVDHGPIAWSNELALHVVELKTNGPAPRLAGLAEAFQHSLRDADALAGDEGARLLPGAMHPWMDPDREMSLWPHDYSPIYQAYDRIFDCRGHGWANLQSVHINLPFRGDRELHALHAAIRHLLPILPALAASSPIADGRDSGFADYRMEVYRHNARRIPEIAGVVIPPAIGSADEYQARILAPMYRAIAPFDPDGVLQEEWLNSHGAIARFDRNAIEIRVLDTQERPHADLAIVALITSVLRALVEERFGHLRDLDTLETARLASLFRSVIERGDATRIEDSRWLQTFGIRSGSIWACDLWSYLLEACSDHLEATGVDTGPLELILDQGTLATRLRRALGLNGAPTGPVPLTPSGTPPKGFPREQLTEVWVRLADCLRHGTPFDGR